MFEVKDLRKDGTDWGVSFLWNVCFKLVCSLFLFSQAASTQISPFPSLSLRLNNFFSCYTQSHTQILSQKHFSKNLSHPLTQILLSSLHNLFCSILLSLLQLPILSFFTLLSPRITRLPASLCAQLITRSSMPLSPFLLYLTSSPPLPSLCPLAHSPTTVCRFSKNSALFHYYYLRHFLHYPHTHTHTLVLFCPSDLPLSLF